MCASVRWTQTPKERTFRMAWLVEIEVWALLGGCEDVPLCSTKNGDKVATLVVVRFSNNCTRPESAVDALRTSRSAHPRKHTSDCLCIGCDCSKTMENSTLKTDAKGIFTRFFVGSAIQKL